MMTAVNNYDEFYVLGLFFYLVGLRYRRTLIFENQKKKKMLLTIKNLRKNPLE